MANENIIVKFQVEGADKFNKDIEKSADVILDVAKANKIADQSSDELAKSIGQTANQLQILGKEGKTSTDEFNKLNTSLKGQISSYEKVSTGATSMRSGIRATREELGKMLLSGEANTAQLYKMAKAGGELSDAMGDASQAISVMASDTFPLDSMLQGVQSITAGLQVAEGAMALFGVENEDLQKTLVKLNALMAITSGLQQLQNSLQKTSALSLGFNVVMQKAYTLAVGESTGAMKLFRLALISTGIGAFVVLLGVAVSAFMKWSESSKQASENLKLLADVSKEANKNIEDERAELTKLVAIAKNENLSKTDRQNAIKQINENYPEYLGNINLENIATAQTSDLIKNQIQLLVQREQVNLLTSEIAKKRNKQELDEQNKELTFLQKIAVGLATFAKTGGNLEANNLIKKYVARNKAKAEAEIKSLNDALTKVLESIGKSQKSVLETSTTNTEKSAKEKSKVVLNELEKLKAELQKKQKEIEAEISRAVVKKGKSETKLSVKLRAEIEGIEQQIKIIENLLEKKPLKAFVELQIQNGQDFEASLKKEIEDAHTKFKDLFNLILQSDGDIKNNSALQEQANQVKDLQEKLNSLMNVYNSYFEKAEEDSGIQLPDMFADFNPEGFINSITETKDVGKDKYKEMYDYINDLREQGILDEERANEAHEALQNARLNSIVENAEKAKIVYDMLYNTMSQGADLARQVISNNSERELQVLEEKKNRGLISEKQYQKEQAKIKNDAARKEHAANTAMAFAQIPMAILSAFVGTPGGIIIKSIAAGVAGAFALATAIMVASAPLPKYRHGGQVFKGNGFVKGRSHSDGGVNAELEGNEFVMKREAVAMYGVNNFNKLNNGLLRPDIFSPNVSNYTNQLERIDYTKEFKKMNEILEFIYQSTEDGNNIAMQVGKKIIAKENRDARRYN